MACIICATGHDTESVGRFRRRRRFDRICSLACLQHAIAEHGRNLSKLPDDNSITEQLYARNEALTEAILAWRHNHG